MKSSNAVSFRCPRCQAPVDVETGSVSHCRERLSCSGNFRDENGLLNFVRDKQKSAELNHYNGHYDSRQNSNCGATLNELDAIWSDPWEAQNQLILSRLGDLRGKSILLLGNGDSEKELALLKLHPSKLIFSDISSNAVKNIKDKYRLSDRNDRLLFATLDAEDLPLPDESVDIVYGYAMVHHLPNLDRFLDETIRVLKPSGRAVFFDDAYAPIWHFAKLTFLRPLMRYSHARSGISPEDERFSLSGGFKPAELDKQILAIGGTAWFCRFGLISYLWQRGVRKLGNHVMHRILLSKKLARAVHMADRFLLQIPGMEQNTIRLVWGLSKPQTESGGL